MKKQVLTRIGILSLAVFITFGLNAVSRKQDRRINLNVSVQEVDVIMKALGKLPLEESGNLYFTIQQQAQTQLAPPAKKDTTSGKPKKQ
jgi:hypothetical protein